MAVIGLQNLLKKFKNLARAYGEPTPSISVGYTQGYALKVHEDLQAFHDEGQEKYLEQPFRELLPDLKRMVLDLVRSGKTVEQALLIAGLYLQGESQKLVPIDTGALRASAFTRSDSKHLGAD